MARGGIQKGVNRHGHVYVYAQKEGKLRVDTSGWEPWRDYPVKGWWIDELWMAHKLSHTTYLEYATKVRVGFPGRLRQLQAGTRPGAHCVVEGEATPGRLEASTLEA